MPITVKFKRVRDNFLPIPSKARPGDAGIDLYLDLSQENMDVQPVGLSYAYTTGIDVMKREYLSVSAGTLLHVPTGFAVEIPPGYEGQVRGRSGLAFKQGCTVFHVGTIDSGYRGEIRVALRFETDTMLGHGDRIAQLIIAPIPEVEIVEADELSEHERGANGFGSSGR